MSRSKTPYSFAYAGAIILLSAILGGGNQQGIWTDHLMEILLIPALFIGFGGIQESRFGILTKILIGLVVALCILQFLPVSRLWPSENLPGATPSMMFSIFPERSLESVLFLISALGFSLMISRMDDTNQLRLLRFFIVGVIVNIFVVVIQLSFSGRTSIEGLMPFTITSGLFANENHLSSYMFALIPLLAFHYLWRMEKPAVYLLLVSSISFILFAIASRAGMVMSLILGFGCLALYLLRKQTKMVRLALFATGAIIVVTTFLSLENSSLIDGNLRATFLANTFKAIKDHGILGTGLGTFVAVYPIYEAQSEIISRYANHVHNEYVELILETGIFGGLIMILFAGVFLRGFGRSTLSMSAGISVIALLVHSTLDYPLRTMAIAILFSYLCALVLSQPEKEPTQVQRSRDR